MFLSGVVAVGGLRLRDIFGELKMNPSAQPDDRDHGDDGERSGNEPEGSGGMGEDGSDDLKQVIFKLDRLILSVSWLADELRSALYPTGNGELPLDGTELGSFGTYLRDAKNEEDLHSRCGLVWQEFTNDFQSASDDKYKYSIIQHLALSIVTIKCNEGLKRFDLEAGVKIGEFLTKVNDQGVTLKYLIGGASFNPDNRESKSASIRRNLKSSGEKMLGALDAEYQKYEADSGNLLADALTNDLLDYLPPNISLSEEAFENLKEFCIQECGSLYMRDLKESLQGRINQVLDALLGVGVIKEGEMLFPQLPE
jgi:hypothetical protein